MTTLLRAALSAISTIFIVFMIVAVAVYFIDRAVFGVNAPGLFS